MMRIEWGSAAARQAGRVCPTGARRNGLLPRASSRKRHTFRKTFIGGTISAAIDCGARRASSQRSSCADGLTGLARPHDCEVFGLDVDDPAKQDGIRPSEPATQSDAAVKDAGQRPAPRSGAERP